MSLDGRTIFRTLLFILGVAVVITGIGPSFGGLDGYVAAVIGTDAIVPSTRTYLIESSHISYIGAVWMGIGIMFMMASLNMAFFRSMIQYSFVLMIFGGVVRLFMTDGDVLYSQEILIPLIIEIIVTPILLVWFSKNQWDF